VIVDNILQYPFSALTLLVGDRKGIRRVKTRSSNLRDSSEGYESCGELGPTWSDLFKNKVVKQKAEVVLVDNNSKNYCHNVAFNSAFTLLEFSSKITRGPILLPVIREIPK